MKITWTLSNWVSLNKLQQGKSAQHNTGSKVSLESEIELYALYICVITIGVQDMGVLKITSLFSKVSACS